MMSLPHSIISMAICFILGALYNSRDKSTPKLNFYNYFGGFFIFWLYLFLLAGGVLIVSLLVIMGIETAGSPATAAFIDKFADKYCLPFFRVVIVGSTCDICLLMAVFCLYAAFAEIIKRARRLLKIDRVK